MIVDEVTKIQIKRKLSDRAMSDLMGVARSTYGNTRTGRIPAGMRYLTGAVRAFPQLSDALKEYFKQPGTRVGKKPSFWARLLCIIKS